MSRKSNIRRTNRRRKARAYVEARTAAHREEALEKQKAARDAYRQLKSIRHKRVFTTGAKALIASVAIMLMFVAGLVSWSVVRNVRQRRDEQTQQEQTPSKMVSSDMVTGMTRKGSMAMSSSARFRSFAKTKGGYDGKSLFGGRVSAEGIDGVLAERQALEDEWQKRAAEREAAQEKADSGRYTGTSPADRTKADGSDGEGAGASGGEKTSEEKSEKTSEETGKKPSESRYATTQDSQEGDAGKTSSDEGGDGTSDDSESVSDEQIRKLIDSAQSTTSR